MGILGEMSEDLKILTPHHNKLVPPSCNAPAINYFISIELFLIIYHFYCGHLVSVFAKDKNTRSHTFYRWFNEIPVLILISIIILVVVKPF